MSDFPEAQTVIYPVYCYNNFNPGVFYVGCTNQLLICLIAFLNLGPLGYILVHHIKKNKLTKLIKLLVLLCMISLQIVTFTHYFFIFTHGVFLMISIQNLLTDIAFVFLCYLFCKSTSRLLPNSKAWFPVLKLIGILSIVFYVIFTLWIQLESSYKNDSVWNSCKTLGFFMLSLS